MASGNVRFDLLYAILSETDSDAGNRLVKDPTTKVIATQSVYTRHKSVVTLAWVQGTAATEGAPYPGANWPALPTPAAGTAVVPLAYVRVNKTNTPATVQYTVDQVFNDTRLVRPNTHTGQAAMRVAAVGVKVGTNATALSVDAKTLATTAKTSGGWGPLVGDQRPPYMLDVVQGGGSLWIFAGPFNSGAFKTFATSWTVLSACPIATPNPSSTLADRDTTDYRNRVFEGAVVFNGVNYGWTGAGGGKEAPTTQTGSTPIATGWGQSFVDDANLTGLVGWPANMRPCCYWAVGGGGSAIALAVDKTSGALYLMGIDVTGTDINPLGVLSMRVHYSPAFANYGL